MWDRDGNVIIQHNGVPKQNQAKGISHATTGDKVSWVNWQN